MWSRGGITFVNADVLDGCGGRGRTLRVRGRRIDGLDVAPARGDVVVDLDGGVLLPGLINAHDHLELNTMPRLKWRARHRNVREWIADFQPRFTTDHVLVTALAEPLDDRLWVGGLKNLLAGVTTVCHHNPLHRALQGLFPVRVVQRFGFSHSLQVDGPARVATACRETPESWPWLVHAAEGIDDEAASEIPELRRLGCMGANTVIVHGVAVTCDTASQLVRSGVSLVWCPTSNEFLFGSTADIRRFDDAGRLAIGSDSRLSGEGDLLDEMRAAHATRQTCADGIVRAVTSGAADILRLQEAGRLRPGGIADLTVIRCNGGDPHQAVVGATRGDVLLTMIGGRPRIASPAFSAAFTATGERAVPVRLDGQHRLLAEGLARRTARSSVREQGLEVPSC